MLNIRELQEEYFLEQLRRGKDIVLVSDGEIPGISDFGYGIVRLARENDIAVTVIFGTPSRSHKIGEEPMRTYRLGFPISILCTTEIALANSNAVTA